MRIVNENLETIKESEVDLTKGRLVEGQAIRADAIPIDNITKFAWYDDDYEDVMIYMLYKEFPMDIPEQSYQTDELTEVIDALLGYGGE
jgi:hypothetical protein